MMVKIIGWPQSEMVDVHTKDSASAEAKMVPPVMKPFRIWLIFR
jgi:hypothetical protein